MNDRPSLRELVAKAINARDLSHSDVRETPIDRIGALAFADPLGVELLAAKWARDEQAEVRAHKLLLHRTKRICGDSSMRSKLCRVSLDEWLDDKCRYCLGRGLLAATPTAPARICHVCRGSGGRQVNELWRANKLEIDVAVYRKLDRRYQAIQRHIVDAELMAVIDVSRQLGRVAVA